MSKPWNMIFWNRTLAIVLFGFSIGFSNLALASGSSKACQGLLQEIKRLERISDTLIEDFETNKSCKPGPDYEDCRKLLANRLELILDQLIEREVEYESQCI